MKRKSRKPVVNAIDTQLAALPPLVRIEAAARGRTLDPFQWLLADAYHSARPKVTKSKKKEFAIGPESARLRHMAKVASLCWLAIREWDPAFFELLAAEMRKTEADAADGATEAGRSIMDPARFILAFSAAIKGQPAVNLSRLSKELHRLSRGVVDIDVRHLRRIARGLNVKTATPHRPKK
jgi:hypothetical protein